jgi:heptosyltransferase III
MKSDTILSPPRRPPAGRLLVVHQGALGDVVLAFPAMAWLARAGYRLDLACQSQIGRLACCLGVTENYLPIESAAFATLFTGTVDPEIAAHLGRYRAVLSISFSRRLEESLRKIDGLEVFSIPPRPPAHKRIHVADHLKAALANLRPIGFSAPEADSPGEDDSLASSRTRGTDSRRILLHPGAGSRRKCWPVENFIAVGKTLEESGYRPEAVIGPAEEYLLPELGTGNLPVHDLHQASDLTALLELLEGSGGLIGNDSGVTHLAAHIGLPTVAIFGPTDPLRWKPLGPAVTVLGPAGPCASCFEDGTSACDAPDCLTGILPEQVLEALSRVRSLQPGN